MATGLAAGQGEGAWPGLGRAVPDPRSWFQRRGAAPLGRVLDDAALTAARTAFDELVPRHGVTGPYATIVHDAWRHSTVLAAMVPRLGSIACAAIEVPELVLFHDHLLHKPAGGADMEWHQDFSYLPLDRADGLTLWIALDDITEDNGCLYYVLGSHALGERRAAWGLVGDGDPRAVLPPIEVGVGEPGAPAPTGAGCAVAHHALVWHRSPRNDSGAPRRSWALSFVVPEARWSPAHSPHPRSAVAPRHEGQELETDLLRVRAGG
jgi:ectoine hydroxylase-related dioxygenase (phytanoyl-CoA dioxygenase family)